MSNAQTKKITKFLNKYIFYIDIYHIYQTGAAKRNVYVYTIYINIKYTYIINIYLIYCHNIYVYLILLYFI